MVMLSCVDLKLHKTAWSLFFHLLSCPAHLPGINPLQPERISSLKCQMTSRANVGIKRCSPVLPPTSSVSFQRKSKHRGGYMYMTVDKYTPFKNCEWWQSISKQHHRRSLYLYIKASHPPDSVPGPEGQLLTQGCTYMSFLKRQMWHPINRR